MAASMDWESYPSAVHSLYTDEKLEKVWNPHIHFYGEFRGQLEFRTIKRFVPRADVRVPRGTGSDCVRYISKEDPNPITGGSMRGRENGEDALKPVDRAINSSQSEDLQGTTSAPYCIQRYLSTDGRIACVVGAYYSTSRYDANSHCAMGPYGYWKIPPCKTACGTYAVRVGPRRGKMVRRLWRRRLRYL